MSGLVTRQSVLSTPREIICTGMPVITGGGGGVDDAVPTYTPADLEQDASRMLEYIQPPLPAETKRMASTDADLRLMSVLLPDVAADRVAALVRTAEAENEQAMMQLQDAENKLRECINEAFILQGEPTDDNDDVSLSLERLATLANTKTAALSRSSSSKNETQQQHSTELAELYAARACTQLLADAEEAMALAHTSSHTQQQLVALVRLATLVEDAQHRGPSASPMLSRTIAILTDRRDELNERLRISCTDALRSAMRAAAWPPVAYESPEKFSSNTPRFQLLGHPALERAWTDLCEWQFTAASVGLTKPPTCIQAPATISGVDRLHAMPAAPGSDAYVPLVAVQVMMEPILLRFRYHFDGARPTNRLDKPEWFLAHVVGLIQVHRHLFEPSPDPWTHGGDVAELTRKRSGAMHDAPLRQRYVAVDAPSELLHTLLHPLRQKIQASMERLVHERALLAHNILQLITFDIDLRDTYAPARLVANGHGAVRLADEILGNEAWFQAWVNSERTFAERRFDTLLQAPGAWTLVQSDTMDDEEELPENASDDTAEIDADTTTRCACSLMNMLAGVTERYRPLQLLPQRCAFIIKVQRPLLDVLHNRLVRHLDAFENMSTAFSRALPGEIASFSAGPGSDLVRGEHGVTRVAKALLSAEYVKKQLQEWSESTFFLSMAHDVAGLDKSSPLFRIMTLKISKDDIDSASLVSVLQRGLQRGASAAAHLRPLAPSSQASTKGESPYSYESPDTTSSNVPGIWDYHIRKFDSIATRSAHALERLTVTEVLELLKPYILRRWDRDELGADPDGVDSVSNLDEQAMRQDVPSRELVPALSKLTKMLQLMVQVLPPNLLLPVYRHIASSLSHAIVERILMPSTYLSFMYLNSLTCSRCPFFTTIHSRTSGALLS